MPHYKYLIVGGGMTAAAAIAGIRSVDAHGSLAVVGDDPHPPYDRPPLTKELWKHKPVSSIWRKTYPHSVTFYLGRTVRRLDPPNKRVVDDEGTAYSYEKLLLATGSTPHRFSFGGKQIIYFRTFDDYQRLRAITTHGERFAVIGSGFIGSEIAAALAMNGKKVIYMFPEHSIGAEMYPPKLAKAVNALYRKNGIELLAGTKVTGCAERNGKTTLTIRDGKTKREKTIMVDAAIAGLGVQPNVQLARAAGLTVHDGIRVDALLRTSRPDIYAAGDVASFHNPALDRWLRVEHEDNANKMGRCAGASMAGRAVSYTHQPFFYSELFDWGYQAVGRIDSTLNVVCDWKDPCKKGVLYYLQAGRVRGVLLWNVSGQLAVARALIAAPGPFTPADIKGRIRF